MAENCINCPYGHFRYVTAERGKLTGACMYCTMPTQMMMDFGVRKWIQIVSITNKDGTLAACPLQDPTKKHDPAFVRDCDCDEAADFYDYYDDEAGNRCKKVLGGLFDKHGRMIEEQRTKILQRIKRMKFFVLFREL